MILSGEAPRKPWDLLTKNPQSSSDTPLKPSFVISEIKTWAILSATSKHPKLETKSATCKTLLACKRHGIWGKSFPVY